MSRLLLPLVLLLATASCADAPLAAESDPRGPLPDVGKADWAQGTCQSGLRNSCGGPSDGACWCDELCTDYGDCCADHHDACTLPGVLRVADRLAPSASRYPVYFDTTDLGWRHHPLRLELSRPGAASMLSSTSTFNQHARVGDWLHSINPQQRLGPCAIDGADCEGQLELSLWADAEGEESTLLARRQVQVTAPAEPLSAAPCRGVGNVANFRRLSRYGAAVGSVVSTRTHGAWTASRRRQSFDGVPSWRILVAARDDKGSHYALDVAIPEDLPRGVPVDVRAGFNGPGAWIGFDGGCGSGQLVVHELDDGEVIDGDASWLSRLTLTWETECSFGHAIDGRRVSMPGCLHFDAKHPALLWSTGAPSPP